MDAQSGLPANWEVRFSRSRKLPYYYNSQTQESQWVPPTNTDGEKLKQYMASKYPPETNTAASGRSEKVRASHLLVKHKDSRRPSSWKQAEIVRTKDQARELLQNYRDRITAGEISFADLASTESDCSSARKGGDLGFFGAGEMQKSFEDAAFALEVGELSPIIESDSGLHIILRTA
ncbi:hypothetical protein CANCADRAFT_3498 [Tortispora caseinolytica NRRL Y-17796]|uniref:Peptidyl-prolyl cis-trans isomerase n=1 Tax=Tortispora caseinolytica NRRL Y-17796 TaxID=767744 RepID=A0A1E4TAP9_9ASCO|nr:hypothetical protein CANCADRAFT_3498 [Tortispora caseinolytica NRRL Y-17796]